MIELLFMIVLPVLTIGIVALVCRRGSWPLPGAAPTELDLFEMAE